MALYSPVRKFLFVHCYRTGGNTLRSLLRTDECQEIGAPHALSADVKAMMTPEEWDAAYRFTIVRHPYTWLASTWDYVIHRSGHRDYEHALRGLGEYVRWIADVGLSQDRGPLQDRHAFQHEFARDMCDVYRFEDHPNPIHDVCSVLDIDVPPELPWIGKSESAVTPDAATKTLIQRVWARDFEELGYDA